ncbi:MAG: M14 family metallopeptidase [Elusimicrobiales bacterium]|nr:M14 family metallopeptidase [Elusimicrobiales bacterium]
MKKNLLAAALAFNAPLAFCLGPYAQLEQAAGPRAAAPAPEPRLPGAFDHLAADTRYWVTVAAEDKFDRTALLAAGLDIAEIREGFVSGLIEKTAMEQLAAKGFFVKSRQPIRDYAKNHLKDFPAADAPYHNYAETLEELRALAAANPAETSLFSLGKTVQGRDIWCLRINPAEKGEAPSARPAAFFMGNHHGREHLSNEVALGVAAYLLERKTDPEIRRYLDTLDIYVAPMTNPDGAEYDLQTGKYRWHRKNARVNPDKSIGVDLNRNYDSRWCQAGASHSPGADTYCGPYAFSEPETLAVKAFIETRPGLRTLMSYHSYSSLLLYPWAGKSTPVESARDRKVFETMAKAMAAATGYRPQQASDLYVATGDTMDWAYEKRGVFAFTTELEGTTFYPGAAMIGKAVPRNVKAAMYMLSVTEDPYKLAQ